MTMSYIIAARRSPVAPHNGVLAHLELHELAAPVLAAVLQDTQICADDIGELIVSNALGAGGNPARSMALAAGFRARIAGLSIDRQCAGGLDALTLADAMIRSGLHNIVVAGGVESYSRRPLRARTFPDGSPPEPYSQAAFTPWPDRDPNMADAADILAQSYAIDKNTQDAWAIASHQKAQSFTPPEIVEMSGFSHDPFTRNLTEKHCARAPQISGTITAANMAVAADGAAFVVMVSESFIKLHGLQGVAFHGGITVGGDPMLPGLAPIAAINQVLKKLDLTPQNLTSAQIMEAFAVQAIACVRGANIPEEIVNQHGGALGRGHPIGASGTILAVRLFHELRETGGVGLAAIAAAGGLGSAVILGQTHESL